VAVYGFKGFLPWRDSRFRAYRLHTICNEEDNIMEMQEAAAQATQPGLFLFREWGNIISKFET
jgi:hypothetical protein